MHSYGKLKTEQRKYYSLSKPIPVLGLNAKIRKAEGGGTHIRLSLFGARTRPPLCGSFALQKTPDGCELSSPYFLFGFASHRKFPLTRNSIKHGQPCFIPPLWGSFVLILPSSAQVLYKTEHRPYGRCIGTFVWNHNLCGTHLIIIPSVKRGARERASHAKRRISRSHFLYRFFRFVFLI